MKDAIKVLILLFLYPVGIFLYVPFNGYPSMAGAIMIMLSVPLMFGLAVKI